jgi:hypothetical protein
MALVSPRVFWNIVRIHGGGDDLPSHIKALCPDADWSFFDQRRRNLSAKALENHRQTAERRKKAKRRSASPDEESC